MVGDGIITRLLNFDLIARAKGDIDRTNHRTAVHTQILAEPDSTTAQAP
jgi:hypothetical protein